MEILVTGSAGFIGYHLADRLCQRGDHIIGIDNLNHYYDPALKNARLQRLKKHPNFEFIKLDLANEEGMKQLFNHHTFDVVVNLAAQAGVRYSLKNPQAYMNTNMIGFCNVLEGCRQQQIKHLVFASSSSVYGANTKFPFSENDTVDHPVSLYAASKKANELMAHCYAHLYGIPCTGLRFFTVYGPWGRPDMALFKFTKNILEEKPIDVYNNGEMYRDFTYIDDIIEGVVRTIDQPATINPNWSGKCPDPATSYTPYRIYNIGGHNPIKLLNFITALEKALGKKAIKTMLPIQPGDVLKTYADTTLLESDLGYKPCVKIEEGIQKFVDWYLEYQSQAKGAAQHAATSST